ncbi:hypothetical protein [Streptomyces sp. NPDC085665]|uniref:hypothetical protein n=1 Tax=Streptomyces sp. NPDC085665 TaxID=3365735 RepID=UPI0037D7EDB2
MSEDREGPAALPVTLAEKIEYLLERAIPPSEERPSDRQVADSINEDAGTTIISHVTFGKLRKGQQLATSDDRLDAISDYFGVNRRFLKTNHQDAVRDIAEQLDFLASVGSGDITGTAGRGADLGGLSPDLLAYVNNIIRDVQENGIPGSDDLLRGGG